MVPAIALAALLAAVPCPGHQARSDEAKKAFVRANPCPGGPDQGSTHQCRGYVVDHICPLACCGLDAPQNMQWQAQAESKAKDAWELKDCERYCGGPAPAAPKRKGSEQAPPKPSEGGAPTAKCRDGTISYARHHFGACSGHGGVAEWLDE
jgi:Protein of unknown function (DUF3761)